MYNNIIFIGGIHGVGKSTICKQVCAEFKINYLSASEILKWKDVSQNGKDKTIKDILFTQNLLLEGLKHIVDKKTFYILDGHFCLLDADKKIKNVPLETFELIKPILVGVIIGDISEIQRRLTERDNKTYEFQSLNDMQTAERERGQLIATKLNIPFIETHNHDIKSLTQELGAMNI